MYVRTIRPGKSINTIRKKKCRTTCASITAAKHAANLSGCFIQARKFDLRNCSKEFRNTMLNEEIRMPPFGTMYTLYFFPHIQQMYEDVTRVLFLQRCCRRRSSDTMTQTLAFDDASFPAYLLAPYSMICSIYKLIGCIPILILLPLHLRVHRMGASIQTRGI